MIKRTIFYTVNGVLVTAIVVFLAWATSPDPKFNPASFEGQPVVIEIAPLEEAVTVAQFLSDDGEMITMLVTAYDEGLVSGIDLANIGAPRLENPFAVLESINHDQLAAAVRNQEDLLRVDISRLAPAGPRGDWHIAVGTNFPEHAEEAASESVFLFPKFGTATPSRTTVAAPADGLLDYEVELCMRFDRPITTLIDFDTAAKGLFLCADFTERTALLQLADQDDLDSGFGFTDAKSGVGYFPTGPFLVIPRDWASFVANVRMTTEVNGEPRQDARGGEMIMDFRELSEKALSDMSEPRFFYKGNFYKLAPKTSIAADMTLMSGTSEGVIFTIPTRRDYLDIFVAYARAGGPFGDKSLKEVGIQKFISNEIASRHYLQPGNVVIYRSSVLGDIEVQVTN